MADIELVIKIDEDEYKARQRWFANPRALINVVDKAIATGTVLPERHGRLIDADKLGLTDFEIVICDGNSKKELKMLCEKIENAPTILDAKMG